MSNEINNTLTKGITNTTINDIKTISDEEINVKNRELLEPLIKDKQILDIMLQEGNLEKLKLRFKTQIEIKDEENNNLMIAEKYGMTIRQIKQDLNSINKGEEVEKSVGIAEKLKFLEWETITWKKNGYVGKITAKVRFVKG